MLNTNELSGTALHQFVKLYRKMFGLDNVGNLKCLNQFTQRKKANGEFDNRYHSHEALNRSLFKTDTKNENYRRMKKCSDELTNIMSKHIDSSLSCGIKTFEINKKKIKNIKIIEEGYKVLNIQKNGIDMSLDDIDQLFADFIRYVTSNSNREMRENLLEIVESCEWNGF
jgi:hypothetical protein